MLKKLTTFFQIVMIICYPILLILNGLHYQEHGKLFTSPFDLVVLGMIFLIACQEQGK